MQRFEPFLCGNPWNVHVLFLLKMKLIYVTVLFALIVDISLSSLSCSECVNNDCILSTKCILKTECRNYCLQTVKETQEKALSPLEAILAEIDDENTNTNTYTNTNSIRRKRNYPCGAQQVPPCAQTALQQQYTVQQPFYYPSPCSGYNPSPCSRGFQQFVYGQHPPLAQQEGYSQQTGYGQVGYAQAGYAQPVYAQAANALTGSAGTQFSYAQQPAYVQQARYTQPDYAQSGYATHFGYSSQPGLYQQQPAVQVKRTH